MLYVFLSVSVKDKDAEITKLFHQGLGARKIAEKLDIKHHVSVFKRLKRLGLKRGKCVECPRNLDVNDIDPEKLRVAAEHYARYFFVLRGYPVFTPEPGAPYDLIVDFDGEFKKIQVKSGTQIAPSGNCSFELRRSRNNASESKKKAYRNQECDFFFLLGIEGSAWLIPFQELRSTGRVTPALRYPGYQVM